MLNATTRFLLSNALFTIAIITSFLGNLFPRSGLLMYVQMASAIIYLLFGWYFFRAYYPEGLLVTRFVMGYFYAGIFFGSLFIAADWPFKTVMICASVFWIAIQAGLVIAVRKTVPQRGYYQFLIEAILMLAVITLHIVSAF